MQERPVGHAPGTGAAICLPLMAMDEETALARVDAVKRAIEQADIETIAKHIRLVDAATKYAKAKKWSTTAWEAGAWSMEARRAAGKILLSVLPYLDIGDKHQ